MEPDNFDHAAWQALRRAIRANDAEAVANLISTHPILLGAESPDSCLHLAVSKGSLEIIRLLLSLGADINRDIVDYCGSPLDCAASQGRVEVVNYLISQGASLAVPRPDRNPLFSAICDGHVDALKVLLEAGVNPHVVYRRESGQLRNALSFAQDEAQPEIEELLLENGCRLPIEGVDQPVWEPERLAETTTTDDSRAQIIACLTEQFGPVDPLSLQEIVPLHDEVHVSVNVIRPNDRHPYLTLFTTGMSDLPMTAPEGQEDYRYAELVIHLPADWPHPRDADSDTLWPVDWLRKLAYFPHWNETWLGGRFAIIASDDPPVPLGPNTQQTCLLLMADFGDWSPVVLGNGNRVHFYTVVPLYTEERDFERRIGMAPLLARLPASEWPLVVNVNRANVAAASE